MNDERKSDRTIPTFPYWAISIGCNLSHHCPVTLRRWRVSAASFSMEAVCRLQSGVRMQRTSVVSIELIRRSWHMMAAVAPEWTTAAVSERLMSVRVCIGESSDGDGGGVIGDINSSGLYRRTCQYAPHLGSQVLLVELALALDLLRSSMSRTRNLMSSATFCIITFSDMSNPTG